MKSLSYCKQLYAVTPRFIKYYNQTWEFGRKNWIIAEILFEVFELKLKLMTLQKFYLFILHQRFRYKTRYFIQYNAFSLNRSTQSIAISFHTHFNQLVNCCSIVSYQKLWFGSTVPSEFINEKLMKFGRNFVIMLSMIIIIETEKVCNEISWNFDCHLSFSFTNETYEIFSANSQKSFSWDKNAKRWMTAPKNRWLSISGNDFIWLRSL